MHRRLIELHLMPHVRRVHLVHSHLMLLSHVVSVHVLVHLGRHLVRVHLLHVMLVEAVVLISVFGDVPVVPSTLVVVWGVSRVLWVLLMLIHLLTA